MSEAKEHSWIPKLKQQFANDQIDRREFLRSATLLGLSAGAAYAFVGPATGTRIVPSAQAAMPQGGHLRIGMRAIELLRQQRPEQLHSRKLRSFAEVAFQ